jgi:hypothetical protein
MASDPKKLLLVAPFAPETRVQYFDSRDIHESNDYLHDEELKSKLPKMVIDEENSFVYHVDLGVR